MRLSKSVYFDNAVDADFTFENVCLGETIDFDNVSTIPEGGSPTWEWDFGDGGTSTDESPSHTFATAGTYSVRLVGVNDLSCNDTALYEVIVYPLPIADIEFIAGGLSSELGSTGDVLKTLFSLTTFLPSLLRITLPIGCGILGMEELQQKKIRVTPTPPQEPLPLRWWLPAKMVACLLPQKPLP